MPVLFVPFEVVPTVTTSVSKLSTVSTESVVAVVGTVVPPVHVGVAAVVSKVRISKVVPPVRVGAGVDVGVAFAAGLLLLLVKSTLGVLLLVKSTLGVLLLVKSTLGVLLLVKSTTVWLRLHVDGMLQFNHYILKCKLVVVVVIILLFGGKKNKWSCPLYRREGQKDRP